MVKAYVMVKTLVGEVDSIRDEIRALEGVTDAHIVAGDVDIIATVAVESPAEIKELVASEVHELEGVESTNTYIAMD